VPYNTAPRLRERCERGIYRRRTRDGKTRYEYAYVDRAGKQRWGTCEKLADARRERAAMNGKPQEERIAPTHKTFAEIAEEWYEAKKPKLRPRTAGYYRDALDLVLLPRFGRVRLARIDADAIAKLTRELEREGLHAVNPARPVRPLGASSISNYLKPLQGTLALGARRGWIASNPFTILTTDDRPTRNDERPPAHEWTADELAALLAASKRSAEKRGAPEARPYDYSTLLLVTATLGLRLGEALGLRWQDFEKGEDANAAVLRVERQWLRPTQVGGVRLPARYGPPKTKAGKRVLAVPSDLRDELIALRLRSDYSRDEHPIFASLKGTPLAHRNVTRRGWQTARDEAGLPGSLCFHDLRHAAASRLIASGVDDVMVADQVGHGDSAVTRKVYAHVYDRTEKMDQVRAALAGAAITRANPEH
jgi:integrase